MPRFEVFCPAAPPEVPVDITLRVDAEHWLAALKVGLQRAGITQSPATNVLCDVQADGSIHVTDPRGGGVFRIQELRADGGAPAAPRPAATPVPIFTRPPSVAVPVPTATATPAATSTPAASTPTSTATPAATSTATPAATSTPAASAPTPTSTATPAATSTPTSTPAASAPTSTPTAAAARIGGPPSPPTREDVLTELFERVGEVIGAERDTALQLLLDLALEKVDAEAGSIFLAALGSDDLEFVVARGPRARELLALGARVPMGVGIVGFCAKEDVCLAISDAQADPRFHRAVSEAIGYETRSILCAPIARHGRVFGALEVLNKRGGRAFDATDLAVVAYLAHHAAEHLAR